MESSRLSNFGMNKMGRVMNKYLRFPTVGQRCRFKDAFGYWCDDGEVISVDASDNGFWVSSASRLVPPQYDDSLTHFYSTDVGTKVIFNEEAL